MRDARIRDRVVGLQLKQQTQFMISLCGLRVYFGLGMLWKRKKTYLGEGTKGSRPQRYDIQLRVACDIISLEAQFN